MTDDDPWTKKSWQRPWTKEEMIANASNWSLAGDAGLLLHLQKFSDDLIKRSKQTLDNIDSMFESTIDTQIALSNVTNHFMGLHHTQFVESRVYDEDETEIYSEAQPVKDTNNKEVNIEDNLEIMKRVVEKGLHLLDTHFEKIEVSDSETDDESDGSNFIIQPKDPYINHPLSYIIGTKEWFKNPHFGLQSSDSDESLSGESTPREKNNLSQSRLTVSDSLSDTDSDFDTSSNKQLDSLATKPVEPSEYAGDIFESNSESENDIQKSNTNINSIFAEELVKKLGKVTSNIDSSMIKRDEDVYGNPDSNLNINKPKQTGSRSSGTDLFADEPPPLDNFTTSSSHSENLFDDINDDLFWDTASHQKQKLSNEPNDINLLKEDDTNTFSVDSTKDFLQKSQKSEPDIEKSINPFKIKSIFDNEEDDDIDDLFSSVKVLDTNKTKNYLPQKSGTAIAPLVSEQPPPIDEIDVKKKKLPGAVLMIGGTDSLLVENVAKLLKTRSHSTYEEEKSNTINETNAPLENKKVNTVAKPETATQAGSLNKVSKPQVEVHKEDIVNPNPKKKVLSLFDDDDDYNDFDFLDKKSMLFKNNTGNLNDNKPIEKENEENDPQKQNIDIFDNSSSTKRTDLDTSKVDIFSDSFKSEDIFSTLKAKNLMKGTFENTSEHDPNINITKKKYSVNIFDDTPDEDIFSAIVTNKNFSSVTKESNTATKSNVDNKNEFITSEERFKKIDLFSDSFDNDDLFAIPNSNKIIIEDTASENQSENIFRSENSNKISLEDSLLNQFKKNLQDETILQKNENSNNASKPLKSDSDIFSNTTDNFTDSDMIDQSEILNRDIEQSYKSHTYNIFDNEPPELDLLDKNEDARSEVDTTDLFDSEPNKEFLESKYTTMFEETPPPLTNAEKGNHVISSNTYISESDKTTSAHVTKSSSIKNLQQSSLFSDQDKLFNDTDDNISLFKSVITDDDKDLFQNVTENVINKIDNSVDKSHIVDNLNEFSGIKNEYVNNSLFIDNNLHKQENKDMTSNEDKLSKGNSYNQYLVHDNMEDYAKTDKKAFTENDTKIREYISTTNNKFCNDMAESEEIDGGIISTKKKYKDSPGKLKHSLQIDVTALIPGAKPNKSNVEKSLNFDIPATERIETLESTAHKERVRIPVKRRPSTRQARQNAIRNSQILIDTDSLQSSNDKGTEQETENKIKEVSSVLKLETENKILKTNTEDKVLNVENTVLKINSEIKVDETSIESIVSENTDHFLVQSTIEDQTNQNVENNYSIEIDKTDIGINISDSETVIDKIDSNAECVTNTNSKSLLFSNDDSDDDLFSFDKKTINDVKKEEKSEQSEQKFNILAPKEENLSSIIKIPPTKSIGDLFVDDDLFVSKPKTDVDMKQPLKAEKPKSSNIFSDEDDDDLFGGMNIKQTSQVKVVETNEKSKPTLTKIEKPKKISLVFSDEEDDLFGGNKSQVDSKPKSSLYDDKLSSKLSINKTPLSSQASIKKPSLFDNNDDDDETDIFSFKTKGKTHSTIEPKISSGSKPTKPVVQQVFDDPLLSNSNQDE